MLYQHHVLTTQPRGAAGLARTILDANTAKGGVFVFTPQIGLSSNHVVVISAFADEAAACGSDVLAGASAGIERHELWDPDPRPVAGETFPETDGFFSHRWFDVATGDWPRFRELSLGAWDNWEDVHDSRVIGFWRSRAAPAPGLMRIWLMSWYKNLAAWEDSRWYLNSDRAEAATAFENFRARGQLTQDTAVSILRRVV
jgi:hypothetical protein